MSTTSESSTAVDRSDAFTVAVSGKNMVTAAAAGAGEEGGAKVAADGFLLRYALSAMAATVAEVATYPLDLTKTRLQIQGERGGGVSGVCTLPQRGMVKTAIGIVQEEGLLKLWQGVTPAIYRHVVYTGCRMGAYEQLRDLLGRNSDGSFPVWKAVLGGLSAGAFGQFLASPTDLIKIQMQMEGRRRLEGKPPRVKSTFHAFRKILSEGGIRRGLWKGWIPNVQRAALVNMGDLATYDTCKQTLLKHTSLHDNYVTHTLSSAASGLVAATISTPADVIKTRVMNQPTDERSRGLLYRSSLECLMATIREEGFFALYKGFVPTWARMAPWSLTFWLSYEQIRKLSGTASF